VNINNINVKINNAYYNPPKYTFSLSLNALIRVPSAITFIIIVRIKMSVNIIIYLFIINR